MIVIFQMNMWIEKNCNMKSSNSSIHVCQYEFRYIEYNEKTPNIFQKKLIFYWIL